MDFKKIFIVGSPGSGKTTLAIKLSKTLQIPHFDLDDIRFPKPGLKRPDHEALPLVEQLTQQPKWIIEGIYISWVQKHLKDADKIIFLDIPFYIAFVRVVKRYLTNFLSGKSKHGLTSTLVLIKNIIRYHYPKPGTELNDQSEYVTRAKTALILSDHKNIVRVVNNYQEEQLIRKLTKH